MPGNDPPSSLTLDALFERCTAVAPHRVAVRHGAAALTYRELDERANHLAHRLRGIGAGPETLVGLRVERSCELVVGLLGILKAGAAYVPIVPTLPEERARRIVEDAGLRVVVTREALPPALAGPGRVEARLESGATASRGPGGGSAPDNAAYVLYTSGSTGAPKGVVVTHANVTRLFAATAPWFGFAPSDVWTLFHSCAFDFSVFEIWGALAHGGCLVVVDRATTRDPAALLELLARERVTVLCQTPSAFRQLAPAALASPAELALRLVVFGGEALDFATLSPWVERFGDARPRLVNMYGITETTVHVTYRPITVADVASPDGSRIGVPIPDLAVHLLDPEGRPVADGEVGEIHVGGPGVARGYLARPELEAERFLLDPFSATPGSRLYRSGDLARRHPDGDLEFCGRCDDQVQIRGFRVEPGEVAAVLREAPGVRDAAVVARDAPRHGSRLVAYFVPAPDAAPSAGELLSLARRRLPDPMVPAAFVRLPALPLTANGKLDLAALPVPGRRRPDLACAFAPPRTATERALAAVWEEVLCLDRVGRDDDFFELGGHSLLATAMAALASPALGRELPLGAVFAAPTLAALARVVDDLPAGPPAAAGLAPRGPEAGPLPLSASQQRVWFLERLHPTSRAYRSQATFTFRGGLDVGALERALGEIVRRHEIYRTTFPTLDGGPVQVVHAPWRVALPVERVGAAGLAAALARQIEKPLELDRLPIVRWRLFATGPGEHVLLHAEHHLVHDGWSFNVFARELAELYSAYAAGGASPLAEPELQFADFALWQERWLGGAEARRQSEYWRQRLAGSPPEIALPCDRPRPARPSGRGAAPRLRLAPELCRRLRDLSRASNATLFMTLLAAFAALLARVSGQRELAIGTGVANRRQPGAAGLLGMLINNVVLRCDLAGDPTFAELLARVRETALGAYAHQDLPFDRVVEAVEPRRDPARNPLFQVAFSFHDAPLPELDFRGLATEIDEMVGNGTAKFDLNVVVVPQREQRSGTRSDPSEESVRMIWEHSAELFDPTTVERLMRQYERLLAAIAADPGLRLGELPLASEQDRALVAAWNETATPYPRELPLHRLVAEQAERSPASIALELGDVRISYGELEARANGLARRLAGLGVGPEDRVAVLLERSIEAVVAMLGVLEAGAAYLPLEPEDPPERLGLLLRDADARLVLTREVLLSRVPDDGRTVLCLDAAGDASEVRGAARPAGPVDAEGLACVMYTSGSTGAPKGVAVPHRAIVRLVTGLVGVVLGPTETLLQMAPLSFDAATFEIWGALATGARLVLFPGRAGTPREIGETIRRHGVTTLWLTAPLFHQVVEQSPEALSGLRQLLAGGDVVAAADVRRVLERHPGLAVFNGYGPTEATTFTCLHPMRQAGEVRDPVPIGRPLRNSRVHVLDSARRPVGPGVVGEIAIGGDGLARGYLGAPEGTAERFVPDSCSGAPGDRLYLSGDLGRWRSDGTLEFLGRADRQLKVRGHRVEPAEIERALGLHLAVGAAAVRPWPDAAGDPRLAAYVVAAPGARISTPELRAFLEARLPRAMVPAAFVVLASLPLDARGKVDYAALPAPEAGGGERPPGEAPRTPVEAALADIWREVLGRDAFGVDDDFFELGGHSLLAMQVASRVEARLGIGLPLRRIFEAPTIAALAEILELEGPQRRGPASAPIPRRPRGPVSALEER